MGLIEVKTYTSGAEMLANYAAIKRRTYPPRPTPSPEIRLIQKPEKPEVDVWLAMTTEQRCQSVEMMWRKGDTMRQTADRLSRAIGRIVGREAIGTLHRKHRDGLLSNVKFGIRSVHKQWLDMVEGVEPAGDEPMDYMERLCEAANLDVDEVMSSSYRKEDVSSRRAFMYLVCKRFEGTPLNRIAMSLNTYQSTIRLAIKAVEQELSDD